MNHRSGIVAVVGRPSVGKSSLINALCGGQVSITAVSPQTTRRPVRGILSTESAQIVLVDTPGLHRSERAFNLALQAAVERSLGESDAVLYVTDLTRRPGEEEERVAQRLAQMEAPPEGPVIALNKTDRADGSALGSWERWLGERFSHPAICPVSAVAGSGLPELVELLVGRLPEGPAWYPEGYYTDQDQQFRVAEVIREKAVSVAREELPHAIHVEIAELSGTEDRVDARAFLIVERDSQKAILIGKAGSVIRDIRIRAEADLKRIFERPVHLDIRVRVHASWRKNAALVRKITGGSETER